YIGLAETAAKIAVQMFDDRVERIEVAYAGEVAEEDVDLVTASALKGVFQPLEWQANAVNAPGIAEERGVDVTETKTRQSEDFQSLVTVTVGDEDREVSVCGTQFAGGDARIVRIDDYRIDAIPHGHMLAVRNEDSPGVIGFIGTALGEYNLNIAGMFNGRETIGGEALSVYNLDQPVPDEVLAELETDERVMQTTYISLDNGA
ncbi:MAG: D-3-phosphoglycerate dehydrogenase, partial [Salinirussus sp.]